MDAKDLRDLVRFDEDGPRHEELFESEHLWSEIVCLKRLGQWESTLVPAGSELTITNATGDPAVVLLVAAPPPPKRAVSE